jgi:hypothetical protein
VLEKVSAAPFKAGFFSKHTAKKVERGGRRFQFIDQQAGTTLGFFLPKKISF